MKIPYIEKKIENDFKSYFNELEKSLHKSINIYKNKVDNKNFFKMIYPMFVLLESLKNSQYYPLPEKQILIKEYFDSSNKNKLLELSRKLEKDNQENSLIRKGLKEKDFTPYFDELYSDSLILMNNYYLNNYRGCYISLRCILEDLYRHIYYKNHEEEYWGITEEKFDEFSFGLSPQKFREYLPKTSFLNILTKSDNKFKKFDEDISDGKKYTIFKWNDELYAQTSAYVHASQKKYMNLFKSNSELDYDEIQVKEVNEISEKIMILTIVLLICAHRDIFTRFNDYEKSIIFSIFPSDIKYNFRQLLNI
jgi:hypothetical protein